MMTILTTTVMGISILLLAFKTIRQGKRIREMNEEIKLIDQQTDEIWKGMVELVQEKKNNRQ